VDFKPIVLKLISDQTRKVLLRFGDKQVAVKTLEAFGMEVNDLAQVKNPGSAYYIALWRVYRESRHTLPKNTDSPTLFLANHTVHLQVRCIALNIFWLLTFLFAESS